MFKRSPRFTPIFNPLFTGTVRHHSRALQVATPALLLSLMISTGAYAQSSSLSVIYTFTGGADGGIPAAGPLIRDKSGILYGTTTKGGDAQCGLSSSGCGVVFSISTSGSETALFAFKGRAGVSPNGGLREDADGNLYGTTESGGTGDGVGGDGVVFRLSPAGVETVLHDFSYDANGYEPLAGLTSDPEGNLYGTAPYSNNFVDFTYGVVFKIAPNGDYTILHTFSGTGDDGAYPESGLIRDKLGNLFGTTYYGGVDGQGNVYKIDAAGNFSTLHSFSGPDGSSPGQSNLTMDGEGNLYGVTLLGGTADKGVVFKISAAGAYTTLYNFSGQADGSIPIGRLLFDPSTQNLFGTASEGGLFSGACSARGCGLLFVVNASTGKEHVLYSFTGLADGGNPGSGFLALPGTSGRVDLFGTTTSGGDVSGCFGKGCGTIFDFSVR